MSCNWFQKPTAALLLALACAALAVAEAAAAGDQGHIAAATARALARRSLRGIETSIATPAGGNVTSKDLADEVDAFLNSGAYAFGNLVEHLTGGCNHGNWCGKECVGTGGDPIDALDEHCKTHDECLSTTDPCQRCLCHANLIRDIQQVLVDEGCAGDSWSSESCQSKEAVKEAPSIAAAINVQMGSDSCGSQAWREGCPATTYTYKMNIKTSCNMGAGTDGTVRVELTGEDGTSFSTNDLDSLGNDRVMCFEDSYDFEPTSTKILMNCDTKCQVYFKPSGLFPEWEPEYVEVSRSSDSEETYSVKFCSSGFIAEEGWYDFSCCS